MQSVPLGTREKRSTMGLSHYNNTKKSMNILVHRLFLFVRESVVPLFSMLPWGSKTISSLTRQRDALFPRASPLSKQSTGLFLDSPLAEGLKQ